MRTQTGTILATICGIGEAALLSLPATVLADEPLAESAALTYAADATPSPRAVKTSAELAEITGGMWKVAWRVGETVKVSAPDGSVTTLASDAATAGTATLALGAAGCWTLTRTGQGMLHDVAEITVRHSLDGTLGDGTEASPARLVDGDELRDYGAGENYVFTLENVDGLLSRLALPSGFRLEEAGDGVWKLVVSTDGSQYSWAEIAYPVDSEQAGPDRKTICKGSLPVAYSGDDWLGDAAKAATVVFTSPNGAVTTLNLTGTGAQSFKFDSSGKWTVTLTMADGSTRTAVISVRGGFMIIFS